MNVEDKILTSLHRIERILNQSCSLQIITITTIADKERKTVSKAAKLSEDAVDILNSLTDERLKEEENQDG